ncbi:hypothetical protein [Pseudomonas lactis]|uniref:hypothetical protein n=1 Tax=Pseudomonas lactis TaxID=1615674 RepID=UPI00110C89D1|nr:hypothetical protein [Pseudomonas lactis]MBK3440684.1 hypothetical protein [Pseudomonas lactis]
MSWEAVFRWIESHPGLASWVQAVGSIAALGIAIWVSSSQRRDQLKAAEKAAKAKVDALVAVVESASMYVTALGVMIEKNPGAFAFGQCWKLVHKQWLESSIHSLKQLPAHEFGRGDLVRGYFGIVSAINEISQIIDNAVNAGALQELEFVFMCEEVLIKIELVQTIWRNIQKITEI